MEKREKLKEAESEDSRVEYIGNITKLSLFIQDNLWTGMISQEDNLFILKDFLETASTMLLYIYVDQVGKLQITKSLPEKPPLPAKSIYFLKYEECVIPHEKTRRYFMRGTLSDTPLALYQALYEKVMLPIISNPVNNTKWPKEIMDDIVTHIQGFDCQLKIALGETKGRTILPLPEVAKTVEAIDWEKFTSASINDDSVKLLLDTIGNTLELWLKAVDKALSAECECDVDDKALYGPLTDVDFWNERQKNMKFLFEQVDKPIVKSFAKFLDVLGSGFLELLKRILRSVVEGIDEANDIAPNLEEMRSHLVLFETCDFLEWEQNIPDILKGVTSAWSKSKYFSSAPNRIRLLLQKICNVLIKRTSEFLQGHTLFTEDRETSKDRVAKAIDIINLFIDAYNNCRDTMPSPFTHSKLYPWDYPDNRVFRKLQLFHGKMDEILILLTATDTYHHMPNFELNGLQEILLKEQIDSIYDEFCEKFSVFEECKYDPLDIEEKQFDIDFEAFHDKLCDLDIRLGSAISKCCIDSDSASHAFKLMQELQQTLDRPDVESGFRLCIPSLVSKVGAELETMKLTHNELDQSLRRRGYSITYKGTPPTTGALLWIRETREKLETTQEWLASIEKYYVSETDAEAQNDLRINLLTSIKDFEEKILKHWVETIEQNDIVTTKLDQPILLKQDKNYSAHFDIHISQILAEVKGLVKLGESTIPETAFALLELEETLHRAHARMLSNVSWYHKLCVIMQPVEKDILKESWEKIETMLEQGLTRKWNDPDLEKYVLDLYEELKVVYEKITQSQANIEEVNQAIKEWSNTPIYVRETPEDTIDFTLRMTSRVTNQYKAIRTTGELMKTKMQVNAKILDCDLKSSQWTPYVKHLDTILETALQSAIECSLNYLSDNTDHDNESLKPFVAVQAYLDENEIEEVTELYYAPDPFTKGSRSIVYCFENVIEKIFDMATYMERLNSSAPELKKYLRTLPALTRIESTILQHVMFATNKAIQVVADFQQFQGIYQDNIEESVQDFVLFGPTYTDETDNGEEEENFDEDDGTPYQPEPPVGEMDEGEEEGENLPGGRSQRTEEEFITQIEDLQTLLHLADSYKPVMPVTSWMHIDINEFQYQLLHQLRSWIFAFRMQFIEMRSFGRLKKATVVHEVEQPNLG